jgi:hypothetical protein
LKSWFKYWEKGRDISMNLKKTEILTIIFMILMLIGLFLPWLNDSTEGETITFSPIDFINGDPLLFLIPFIMIVVMLVFFIMSVLKRQRLLSTIIVILLDVLLLIIFTTLFIGNFVVIALVSSVGETAESLLTFEIGSYLSVISPICILAIYFWRIITKIRSKKLK